MRRIRRLRAWRQRTAKALASVPVRGGPAGKRTGWPSGSRPAGFRCGLRLVLAQIPWRSLRSVVDHEVDSRAKVVGRAILRGSISCCRTWPAFMSSGSTVATSWCRSRFVHVRRLGCARSAASRPRGCTAATTAPWPTRPSPAGRW